MNLEILRWVAELAWYIQVMIAYLLSVLLLTNLADAVGGKVWRDNTLQTWGVFVYVSMGIAQWSMKMATWAQRRRRSRLIFEREFGEHWRFVHQDTVSARLHERSEEMRMLGFSRDSVQNYWHLIEAVEHFGYKPEPIAWVMKVNQSQQPKSVYDYAPGASRRQG